MSEFGFLVYSIIRIVFIILGIVTLVDYLQNRGQQRRDIMLMFGSMTLAVIVSAINTFLAEPNPFLVSLSSLFLITQPYLLIRLVKYFHKIPGFIMSITVAGLILSGISVMVLNTVEIPWIVVLVTGYFVTIDGYATYIFYRQALQTSGVTMQRLRFTALGSGLLGVALFWIGIANFLPQLASIITFLWLFASIGAAVGLYLGLASPRWLRSFWQLQVLRTFLSKLADDASNKTRDDIYSLLIHYACELPGAVSTEILLKEYSSGNWIKYESGRWIPILPEVIPVLDQLLETQTPNVLSVKDTDSILLNFLDHNDIEHQYIVPLFRKAQTSGL